MIIKQSTAINSPEETQVVSSPDKKAAENMSNLGNVNTRLYLINSIQEGDRMRHFIIIHGEISTPHDYTKLLFTLDTASENDVIDIYLRTPGGYVDGCADIATAMELCKAKVTTHAMGITASCGAILFDAGDESIPEAWSDILYHMPIQIIGGKSLDIRDITTCEIIRGKYLLNKAVQKGHLTEEEYIKATQGRQDVVVTGMEMRKRIAAKAAADAAPAANNESEGDKK